MSVSAGEGVIATELWISFGALVRSYVAATGLSLNILVNVVVTENRIEAVAASAALSIDYDPGTLQAKWALLSPGRQVAGQFQLLSDGTMSLDGRGIDLDHAAIDFAAALLQAAKPAGTEL